MEKLVKGPRALLLLGGHHQWEGGAVQQELGELWVGGGAVGDKDMAELGMLHGVVLGVGEQSGPCGG